jgi:hypothetical protein
MKKEIINKPYKSRWIGGMYISFTIFIVLIYLFIYLFAEGLYRTSYFLQIVLNSTMVFVFSFMLIITVSLYTTKYKIKDGVLTSWSPFVLIKLKLKDIKKVEKIMVPLHFKVGTSFYCGFFYAPNLGWIRSIITNLRDAVLITTKDGRYYMITPSNPKRFMKILSEKVFNNL